MMRYNNLSAYLRARYGGNVEKMCLDGGFTCPNRDGTKSIGGCIFCGERGAGEHIHGKVNIPAQRASFFRARPKVQRAIAYFQNFTGTYAPVERLRTLYHDAIDDSRIVALAIGTRPDAITESVADLLKEIGERVDVWVELGLQTASDETAARINRAYPTSDFDRAHRLLTERGIGVVAHVMIGLPGEGQDELARTIEYLNAYPLFGIKLHSVFVMRDTVLESMYHCGEYTPLTMEEYVDLAVFALTHLPPDLTIHRLTGDCRRDQLVAPLWNADKDTVLSRIQRTLAERDLCQGAFYNEKDNIFP